MNRIATVSSSAFRYPALALAMLGSTFLFAHLAYCHGHGIAEQWTATLQPKLQLTDAKGHFCKVPGMDQSSAMARLEQDYREIRSRMDHHLTVLEYFYANYFRAIVVGATLGAVSGVCLFYIANRGWSNANNYVVLIWTVSTVIAAYYLSYVTVFREQENISDNKALYLEYVSLGNEVLTYCATGKTDDSASQGTNQIQAMKIDEYARQIDKKMSEINNIAIGFDYTKIADIKQVPSIGGYPQPRGPWRQLAIAAQAPWS